MVYSACLLLLVFVQCPVAFLMEHVHTDDTVIDVNSVVVGTPFPVFDGVWVLIVHVWYETFDFEDNDVTLNKSDEERGSARWPGEEISFSHTAASN